MARNKGMSGRITLEIVVFAILTPTNSIEPTGGVQIPILRLSIMMIPKWIGSIPKSVTIGRNIGVKMSTAGVISIKVPTNKSTKLINNKMITGLSLKERRKEVTFCGICSKDITQDIPMEVAMSSNTIEVVRAESINISGK